VVRGQGDDRRLVGYVVPSDRARVVRELARLRRTEQDVLDRVHELPDGRPVFHGGQDDVDARHAEIFTDLGYLRHGITLGADARVVDAGAGIGLFTLFAAAYAPGARLYAFESEAPLADALRRNVALHGIDARVFAHGLSAGPAQHTPDGAADDHRPPTLSDVIAEHGLDRIDLLRVAGPDAGHDVLRGIADADWPGIRQLVVDLRDTDARLKEAVALLEEHGFDVVSEPDGGPGHETAAYRLFARRPADGGTESAEASAPRALPAPAWPNERVLREDLDAALRAALPSYMVPAGYVVLDRLPLTGNGKLDQRALPDPVAVVRPGEPGTAPRTEAERTVAEVWAELLATDADRIDVASNFFSLGGNSLLVTRMINMIKQRTGVELRVQTIFGAERLADLAAEVARRTPDTGPAAPLDVASISESISLVESLTDAELDALDIDDTDLDTES
jgi:acyl carrier protein